VGIWPQVITGFSGEGIVERTRTKNFYEFRVRVCVFGFETGSVFVFESVFVTKMIWLNDARYRVMPHPEPRTT
jgi:hypothetical protein